ncbi:MAG: hypothetical protein KJ871_10590 [Alphaproteobacteria bacterium]|nr:hypothetical protein [Alphaproteobacteria bacterium]MBU2083511.1 hypothetical protein [Alphaproteobacteria bacterium]MBU2143523.1 hypothetical protein [Alphaproteobacteria bacterium]MBU2196076.1 hypothetical protein [Alphaproteobacteria bacterium]
MLRGLFTGVAGIAFAAMLLATAPAEILKAFVPGLREANVSGSVLKGEAVFPQGLSADWTLSPLRSLTTASFAADWALEGVNSSLKGRVRLTSGAEILDVDGVVSIAELSHFANADFGACDLSARLSSVRLSLRNQAVLLEGKAMIGQGRCTGRDVPELQVVSEPIGGSSEVLVKAAGAEGNVEVVRVTLDTEGRTVFTVSPAGSVLFLDRTTTSDTVLEFGPRFMPSNS